jgi:hypothetical protein
MAQSAAERVTRTYKRKDNIDGAQRSWFARTYQSSKSLQRQEAQWSQERTA